MNFTPAAARHVLFVPADVLRWAATVSPATMMALDATITDEQALSSVGQLRSFLSQPRIEVPLEHPFYGRAVGVVERYYQPETWGGRMSNPIGSQQVRRAYRAVLTVLYDELDIKARPNAHLPTPPPLRPASPPPLQPAEPAAAATDACRPTPHPTPSAAPAATPAAGRQPKRRPLLACQAAATVLIEFIARAALALPHAEYDRFEYFLLNRDHSVRELARDDDIDETKAKKRFSMAISFDYYGSGKWIGTNNAFFRAFQQQCKRLQKIFYAAPALALLRDTCGGANARGQLLAKASAAPRPTGTPRGSSRPPHPHLPGVDARRVPPHRRGRARPRRPRPRRAVCRDGRARGLHRPAPP